MKLFFKVTHILHLGFKQRGHPLETIVGTWESTIEQECQWCDGNVIGSSSPPFVINLRTSKSCKAPHYWYAPRKLLSMMGFIPCMCCCIMEVIVTFQGPQWPPSTWTNGIQRVYRKWRLMSKPLAVWNHIFEHVSNCESTPKNLKSFKLELRKVLIQVPKSKILYFPMWCWEGDSFSVQ
jgi:hypothetical protein